MKKNKKWMRAVILGFLTVYLLSMGLSTCLVAFRYQEEFRNEFLSKRTEVYLIMQDILFPQSSSCIHRDVM